MRMRREIKFLSSVPTPPKFSSEEGNNGLHIFRVGNEQNFILHVQHRIGIRQFCFLTAGVPDAGDDKRTVQQWVFTSLIRLPSIASLRISTDMGRTVSSCR